MFKKEVIITYKIDRTVIEGAIIEILRKKFPELNDEFEGNIDFTVGHDRAQRQLGKNDSLNACITIIEERKLDDKTSNKSL